MNNLVEILEEAYPVMSNDTIMRVLSDHGIEFTIMDERVMAHDVWVTESNKSNYDLVDVSGYTIREMREWLGY